MMRILVMILVVSVSLCLVISRIAAAQVVERSKDGAIQFTDAIVGTWDVDKVVISGRIDNGNYGPSVFTKDSWTIQTKNGDQVFKLMRVNELSHPLEATFEHVKFQKYSFAAYIDLDKDELSIVRGIGPNSPIPLPEKMEEGPETLAYTFRKIAKSNLLSTDVRIPLNVRLIDGDSKVLVDAKLKPYFGGKLAYSSEPRGASAKHENSPRTGTVISGNIEPVGDGVWTVLLIIEIGKQEQSENVEATIVRSEKLQVNTVLRAEKTIQIKCGENRTCELTLK